MQSSTNSSHPFYKVTLKKNYGEISFEKNKPSGSGRAFRTLTDLKTLKDSGKKISNGTKKGITEIATEIKNYYNESYKNNFFRKNLKFIVLFVEVCKSFLHIETDEQKLNKIACLVNEICAPKHEPRIGDPKNKQPIDEITNFNQ